ncbi:hypothetical protein [Actinomadura terrae]|uniref:hypothetical protein n=1 Tax=Actinomadura terrae TaxID=604353 RepID=UPI001FA6DE09|nr:hypothetical protein [Actinomadura terrae]
MRGRTPAEPRPAIPRCGGRGGGSAQRLRSAALVRPDRNPPSLLVECWSDPGLGFGSEAGAVADAAVADDAVRRAGVRRAVALGLAALVRADAVLARDVPERAAAVRDRLVVARDVALVPDDFGLAAAVVLRAVDVFARDAAGLRAAVDLDVPTRLVAVERDRLAADVLDEPREVPDFAVELLPPVDFEVADLVDLVDLVPPARVVDLAVVVMTLAAESIALAASVIALVAVVIALVMAVMALADVDALVATDFICVAAALAWLAALVTRVAAVEDVRLDAALVRLAAGLRAVERLAVVREADDLAAVVRLAAGFLAAVDLFADVLFARLAVPRLDVVRDAVLVGTDLPPVMISYGEIYSTLRDALHTRRNVNVQSAVRSPWDATRS